MVHQKIHTVVKEHHPQPVHTSEHVHHKPSHHHGKSHSFEEIRHSFGSHAASDLKPMYVSHSPVHQSSHDAPAANFKTSYVSHSPVHQSSHDASFGGAFHGFEPTDDAFPAYSHDFHSKLYTSLPANIGFGSHEGKTVNYEVHESPEGPVHFNSRSEKSLSPGKMTEAVAKSEAYPYPLPQNEANATDYLFGFDPMASSYDFTDL